MDRFIFGAAYALLGGIVTAATLLSWQKSQYIRACATALLGKEEVKVEVLLKGVNRKSFAQLESWEDNIKEGFTIATYNLSLGVDDCSNKED